MKAMSGIGLADVQAVYSGPEGCLWELVMGEQIHIGGYRSLCDLAERAGIRRGSSGVDLCCCTGAGMRFLTRFRGVASMTGVDATPRVVELGRQHCEEAGLGNRIRFVLADACSSGLPDAAFDFVWGEDAWCYVEDKAALVSEAARMVKPGGTIAFTDWVEGPTAMSDDEAARCGGIGVLPRGAARVFWVNPVADLRVMNLLETCGGRLAGTDFMFGHALDPLDEDLPPMEALARAALADPMVGPAADRAERVCREAEAVGAEAVVVSRIPGASHCALEGTAIRETVAARLGIPVMEIEVPPLSDAMGPALRTRLEALVETARGRRRTRSA